jgi:KDO2-lipid IV(A) lauroyltransferase
MGTRQETTKQILRTIRSWPTWLGLGLLRLIALLPYGAILVLGKVLGRVLFYLAGSRRRIAERNLALCFPEWGEGRRQEVARRHFVSLGQSFLETVLGWWAPKDKLRKLVHAEGLEHLESARRRGKGVIVLSAHTTSLEIGASLMTFFEPARFVYRPHNDPVWDRIINERRLRWTDKSIPRGDVRGMIRTLREKKLLWYAQDQNTQRREAVFVRFFGHLASTNSATARLVKVTGATVLPFYAVRREDGKGFNLIFEQPLENYPTGDLKADTQRINDIIEGWVRKYPEQYYWVHRRFRTRPNRSDPSLYD